MALDPTRTVHNTSAGIQLANVSNAWIASQLDIPVWNAEGDPQLAAALARVGATSSMIFDTDFSTGRTFVSLDLERKIADAKGAPYGVMIGAGIAVLGLLWMYNQPSKGFAGYRRAATKRANAKAPKVSYCVFEATGAPKCFGDERTARDFARDWGASGVHAYPGSPSVAEGRAERSAPLYTLDGLRGLGSAPDRDACIEILDAWWEYKAEGMKPPASLTAKAKACAKAHNFKVRGL